ncbi:uncharacterized protein LOC18444562 isoform X1 [Amborella trichopoda]|nr:uncharacterized protein LOC18444562 isoform X1 [Amborella trichopoda]|eukprot:XP_006854791.2 uncharacterized protein LOC18444562 isoform X1 [Amborella trichopoda]
MPLPCLMEVRSFLFLFSICFTAAIAILLKHSSTWVPRVLMRRTHSKVADLVVTNATIFTSHHSLLFAEAMAIQDSRILHVGNYSSVQDFIGHGTQQLNIKGKVVVPGFIDSHVHFIPGGLQMAQVELHGVKSKDEFASKVKEATKGKEKDSWVLGGGWNNDLWGGDLPTVSWIDDITPNNPVWLSRMDGHMGLTNSVALRNAGVSKYTQDPVGGSIIRTADGEPTGLLVDSAMKLVVNCIPEISIIERRNAMLRASRFALSRGVTTVVDLGRFYPGVSIELSWEDFKDVYSWADSTGNMLIRICLFFPMATWSRLVDTLKHTGRALSQWLFLGGVKAFADGSLGSNSALFYEPYVDEPTNYGLQVTNSDWLLNNSILADKSGLQVAIHAIGDKANDLILDLNEALIATNGFRDRRFRIEHAQHLLPESVSRFGKQGVIASVQPEHLMDDANSAANKLGQDRAYAESYLFHSLLSSNARLAFGSDWPVADIDPLAGINVAVKRMPPGWEKPWIPFERVTLNEALIAHTISAAYACFLDHELGSLSSGKFADFVVLSSDSWVDFEEHVSASVLATYVGGVKAYP